MGRSRSGDERRGVPTEVGEVLRGLLADRGMARGLRLGRLVTAWPEVVGERLAEETHPVSLDERGLVVAVSGPGWAAQVRFLSDEIRSRTNRILGGEEVSSVRVVVAARKAGGGGPR